MMPNDCVTQQSGGGECERIYNEKPIGENDCVNLVYQAANVFDPASLIIRLDGIVLDPTQYIINANNQIFTLVIDAANIKALHSPLDSTECLRIDYNKVQDQSNCISILN